MTISSSAVSWNNDYVFSLSPHNKVTKSITFHLLVTIRQTNPPPYPVVYQNIRFDGILQKYVRVSYGLFSGNGITVNWVPLEELCHPKIMLSLRIKNNRHRLPVIQ